LTQAFSLERVTPSPAVFDFDKLNWLNRHWLKLAAPERVAELSRQYFPQLALDGSAPEPRKNWFAKLLALLVPSVDHLDQLPAKAAMVFGVDVAATRADAENAAVLAAPSAAKVIAELAARARAQTGPVTPEVFKAWMNEVKVAAGVKGKDLFHPVRIALTGAHSGPEFDKLIPLIEEGATLGLGIASVRERLEKFLQA